MTVAMTTGEWILFIFLLIFDAVLIYSWFTS
jgi:hypothetical protein